MKVSDAAPVPGNLQHAAATDFVQERRFLLDEFINAHESAKRDLLELQETIDHTIAVSGTPMAALDELASQIEDRLMLISGLSRKLLAQINEQGVSRGLR